MTVLEEINREHRRLMEQLDKDAWITKCTLAYLSAEGLQQKDEATARSYCERWYGSVQLGKLKKVLHDMPFEEVQRRIEEAVRRSRR